MSDNLKSSIVICKLCNNFTLCVESKQTCEQLIMLCSDVCFLIAHDGNLAKKVRQLIVGAPIF
jgi:hypothetical protein